MISAALFVFAVSVTYVVAGVLRCFYSRDEFRKSALHPGEGGVSFFFSRSECLRSRIYSGDDGAFEGLFVYRVLEESDGCWEMGWREEF